METIKIQLNEIEGMTLKIPTEFSAYAFNKFYNQLLKIAKSSPEVSMRAMTYNGEATQTLPIYLMHLWQDKDECLEILDIWTNQGKATLVEWFKEKKNIDLSVIEISKISGFIANLRSKYKYKKPHE